MYNMRLLFVISLRLCPMLAAGCYMSDLSRFMFVRALIASTAGPYTVALRGSVCAAVVQRLTENPVFIPFVIIFFRFSSLSLAACSRFMCGFSFIPCILVGH